ncbi:hypothetical protein FQA39_LY03330 [Lamprigera yunnana]|nr:hypothetical protein FQA39_LY03330 [Lamprigera yunnana]
MKLVSGLDTFQLSHTTLSKVSIKENKSIQMKEKFDNCKIDVEAQHVFEIPINIESSFPSMREDKLGNGDDENFENLQRLVQGDKSEDDEDKNVK